MSSGYTSSASVLNLRRDSTNACSKALVLGHPLPRDVLETGFVADCLPRVVPTPRCVASRPAARAASVRVGLSPQQGPHAFAICGISPLDRFRNPPFWFSGGHAGDVASPSPPWARKRNEPAPPRTGSGDMRAPGAPHLLGPSENPMARGREVIHKVMHNMPIPAFEARFALVLRYLDMDPGRVFREITTMSTDSRKDCNCRGNKCVVRLRWSCNGVFLRPQ